MSSDQPQGGILPPSYYTDLIASLSAEDAAKLTEAVKSARQSRGNDNNTDVPDPDDWDNDPDDDSIPGPPNHQSSIKNQQFPIENPRPAFPPPYNPDLPFNLLPEDIRRKRIYDRFPITSARNTPFTTSHLHPWVVDNVAQAGRITLLVGDSTAKKTYAMLHLALHASLGLPWLGNPVIQTPVLYMEEDLGVLAINHRITLLNRGLRRHASPAIHIASHNDWNFPDPKDADLLEHLAKDLETRLIILDPFVRLSNWNLESALIPLAHTIRLLREVARNANAAIILVHHLNKRGLYRGVSHLKGFVDTMILARSRPDSPIVHFETHKLRYSAPRDFAARMHVHPPGPSPDYVQFIPYSDPDTRIASFNQTAGFSPLQHGGTRLSAGEAILNHIAFHGPATRRALIAALTGYKPAAIHQALHRLVKESHLHPTAGVPALYRLPDS